MKLPKATLRRIYNAIVLATVASVLLIPFGPLASPLPATPAEAAGVWATKAPMPTARNGLSLGADNGIIYAAGGWNGFHRTAVEAYDTAITLGLGRPQCSARRRTPRLASLTGSCTSPAARTAA